MAAPLCMPAPAIIDHPSPNFGDRPDGADIDILVLHYTGMQSGAAALSRLCDPVASVSSHYLIEEDGRIFRLVAEEKRAWHAGRGAWQECDDVNSHSIGIEIVNPGHEFGYRPFPDAQINALVALCGDILTRHAIAPHRIIAHSDMAPERKEDPGELFPWGDLAQAGIGIWPSISQLRPGALTPSDMPELATLPAVTGLPALADLPDLITTLAQSADRASDMDRILDDLLIRIGYRGGDARLRMLAFQRHWRPALLSGRADLHCIAIAKTLLASQTRP